MAYSINWGDGKTSNYGLTPDYHGIFTHTYDQPGTYTETATATTDDGTYSATATNRVFAGPGGTGVLDYLPVVIGDLPFDVKLTYSDPSNDPVTGYSIDWGDGNVEASAGPAFSHSYPFDPINDPFNAHNFTISSDVSDLSALRGMPLTFLSLAKCKNIHDLRPLLNCPQLRQLILPAQCKDIDFLQAKTSLTNIAFDEDDPAFKQTAAEFWKANAAGTGQAN